MAHLRTCLSFYTILCRIKIGCLSSRCEGNGSSHCITQHYFYLCRKKISLRALQLATYLSDTLRNTTEVREEKYKETLPIDTSHRHNKPIEHD